MNNYKELLKNSFVFLMCNLVTGLVSIIWLPITTAYFATDEYGIFDLAQTIIVLCIPILTLSISDAVLH